MNSGLIKTCAILFLAFSPVAVKSQQTAPEVILFNGKIFTSDAAHPYMQALAIRGERITATGGSTKIRSLAGPLTKEIDLGGRTVIPGINDAHNHLDISPPNRIDLELKSPDPAWPEMKAAIAAAVLKAPKGTSIYGEIAWKIFRDLAVDRDALDQVAPSNPVILETLTNHALILNSSALALAGIRENQPDPAGGRYERSPDGRLTGIIREYAVFNLERSLSDQTSEADALAELHKTLSAAAKWGITTIQDMSNDLPPERCVALLEKLPTAIRVRVMRMPGTTPVGRDIQEGRPVPRSSNPLITVSGTKWMLDGVPLEGTFAPRNDPATVDYFVLHEQLTFPKTELAAMLRESRHDHDQLLVHVSAYPAAAAMLNALSQYYACLCSSELAIRSHHAGASGDRLHLTSAYAEFAEKDKGSLEPGKLADLAVLSQDIFTVDASDLPTTESVLTIVGRKDCV